MWGWVEMRGAPTDSSSRLGLFYLGPCLQAGSESAAVYGRLPPWEFPSRPPSLQLLPAERTVPPTRRKSGLHPPRHLVSFLLHLSLPQAQRTAFLGLSCFPTPGLGTLGGERRELGCRGWQVCAKSQLCHLLAGSSQTTNFTSLSPISSSVNAGNTPFLARLA